MIVKVRPHTIHREAFSASLVPHVGHIFVWEFNSGDIERFTSKKSSHYTIQVNRLKSCMDKVNLMSDSLSIYIHIPFCRTRCGYCDFNTYADYDHLKETYSDAVAKEISLVSQKIGNGKIVHTIYFGGGTPSIFLPSQLEKIINSISENFHCTSRMEISTEANPTCLTGEYLKSLAVLGINRLSLGMQSAEDRDLKILGRRHTFIDVHNSVENARKAGFSNINLDLIFGIPLQTQESFEDSLKAAMGLSPEHLSLYALSVEDSTPLAKQIANGELSEPDDDLAADMYLSAMKMLDSGGFSQYEISNWAFGKEAQCVHNLQYWRNLDYLGFGAGAHSHYNQSRWENSRTIPDYIDLIVKNLSSDCLSPAAINLISLSDKDEMSETMMMGMRLTEEGINAKDFFERFGIQLETIYSKEITNLQKRELVEWIDKKDQKRLRLTQKGRLLGNQVFMEFIRD